MKHDLKITIFLIALFFISQIAGLSLIAYDATPTLIVDSVTNQSTMVVLYEETAAGPRPEVSGYGSLLYIVIGVGIGTLLILLLMKFRLGGKIWKAWYFLAVLMAITITIGVFTQDWIAFIIAAMLASLKLIYKNVYVHNFTEILMYAGIALLLVPLFNIIWASVLLILISIYDMYAVWKSKHMVKLAKFTMKQNLFPGVAINYSEKDKSKSKGKKQSTVISHSIKSSDKHSAQKKVKSKGASEMRQAILGGGDIIFPLIFAGTILTGLLGMGFEKIIAVAISLIVSVTTGVALYLLFYYAKKDRFYPAMPFVSAGCFAGLGIVLALLAFI